MVADRAAAAVEVEGGRMEEGHAVEALAVAECPVVAGQGMLNQ